MFKKMKFSTKLFSGMGIPIAVLLITATVGGYFVIQKMNDTVKIGKADSKASFKYVLLAEKMKQDVIQVQRWLKDISASRARGSINEGFENAAQSKESFLEGITEFKETYDPEKEQQQIQILDDLNESFNNYYNTGIKMARAYISGGPAKGNRLNRRFNEYVDPLMEDLDLFREELVTKAEIALEVINEYTDKLQLGGAIFMIVTILFIFSTIFMAIRYINRLLRKTVDDLTKSSSQLASASSQLTESSHQIAEGSSEQASSLEETSSTLEELSSMVKSNAAHSLNANQFIDKTKKLIDISQQKMAGMSTAMTDITVSGQEIGKIIKTIDEIAFQTNLLALNAAVEAARAGEAGAGFAVVADEVRNLAGRSAESAKNTQLLIEQIIKKISAGENVVTDTRKAFGSVVKAADMVVKLVKEIALSSTQQKKGIEGIQQAIAQLEQVAQENAATSTQTATASKELTAQADQLLVVVRDLNREVGSKKSLTIDYSDKKKKIKGTTPVKDDKLLSQGKETTGSEEKEIQQKKKIIKPDEILPLDKTEEESGFKDFK